MEPNKTANRIHPLMAAAAIGVLLVSLTGIAAMTGLLPTSHSTNTPPTALLAPSSSAEEAKVQANDIDSATLKSAPVVQHNPATRTATPNYAQHAQAPKVCHSCGRVESVQAIKQQAKPSGVGVVAGAVLGGVLGNQIGAGNGRALSTVAGAVGGGFAGNEVEKRTHTTTTYQVHVRMEDGHVRTFPQSSENGWRVGDRVRVVNGALTSQG